MENLGKYDLAPVQIVLTSWQTICSVITTYRLHGLSYTGCSFGLVHVIQMCPSKSGDTGWHSFNNRKGFTTAMEKKSKLKNWKYDFFFVLRETG